MKRTRLFCVLLAAAMLLSLAACGKDDPKESNSLQIGDYALLYKGASIMEDSDGNDALVLTLDFTNNSKDSGSYVWSISETAIQNGAELAIATVFANSDSYDTVIDSQFTDVAPGETLELRTAFVLALRRRSATKPVRSPSIRPHSAGKRREAVRVRILGPEIYCWTGGTATGTAGGL